LTAHLIRNVRSGYVVGTNLFDSLLRGCLGPSLIVFGGSHTP